MQTITRRMLVPSFTRRWLVLPLSVGVLVVGLVAVLTVSQGWASVARAGCQGVACVTTGPRLASVTSGQSVLLDAVLGSLLGTDLDLSLADTQALASGQINLLDLLQALQTELAVAAVTEALAAEVTLTQLLTTSAAVSDDAGLALLLDELAVATGSLTETVRLGDLVQFTTDPGALAAIDLNALDLVVGTMQLFNHDHVVTTPMPVTLSGAALGVPGLANLSLQAQVVEPPLFVCGSDGTQFYAAAMRLALALDLVDLSASTSLGLGGLLPVLQVQAKIGQVDLYLDIARAAGTLTWVDALAQTVTIDATPGLVDLYLGQFDSAVFFDRTTPLSPAELDYGTLGAVQLTVLGLLNLNLGLEVKATAQSDTPEAETLHFSGPYPQTLTAATGTAVADDLLNDLLASLGNGGLRLSSPLPSLVNSRLDQILGFGLDNLLAPLFANDGLLDAVLNDVVDPLLTGMGSGLGEMTVTVLGVGEICPDLAVTKQHSGTFLAGATEVYTLTVRNQGLFTTSAPIQLSDPLPVGLSYQTHSGSGWSLAGGVPPEPGQPLTFVHAGPLGLEAALPPLRLSVTVSTILTGTITNTVAVTTSGDYTASNNLAVDPTLVFDPDPDNDDDGVLDINDPAPDDPCIPDGNALACPTGDFDDDGTANADDPAPTDPCVPNGNALACPTGDFDGDGTANADDPAPTDPCVPNGNALACPTGDFDDDGTPNGEDSAPTEPCVPDGDALACPTGDFDDDGTANADDPAPTDPCVPNGNALACPTGDFDDDGITNADDPAPTDPCVPNPNTPGCPTPTPVPFSPLPTPTPTPAEYTLPSEPVVPQCVFVAPTGGIPDEPIMPLDAYSFAEPQIVMTNSAPIGIQQWLPDNETLLLTLRHSLVDQLVSVKLVDVTSSESSEIVEPRLHLKDPKWLSANRTVVWRETSSPQEHDPGYWLRSLDPPGERRLSADATGASITHDVSPDGTELVFMSLPGGTRPFIWNQVTKTLHALPVDLADWRYERGLSYRMQGFYSSWHPDGNKILFWDGTWVFLYDLTTNTGCEVNLNPFDRVNNSVLAAKWSPNGRYLLLQISQAPPYISTAGPFDQMLVLDTYTGEAVKYALGDVVYTFSWASDSQTVAMIRRTEQQIRTPDTGMINGIGLYLFNVRDGAYQQILPGYFVGATQGLVWSPDGAHLAFVGSLLNDDELSENGGVFVSQVTVN